MKPMVSIIVPIYNAEPYLHRCVDSILNQEYTDFELLLMDDGSKDASGAICDEYAQKDPRVHVVHKENTGVSDTRNQAIRMAKGTYLQFLDSDDWMTPDSTKLLVRSALEYDCDLVISDFYRVVGERVSRKGDIDEDGVMTQEEFAAHMMENPADFYYGVLWNKLYRRDIIEEHELSMEAKISWCEDFMFNLEYIRYAKRIYALQAPIYYYVKTKGSLVSQGISIANTIKMKLMVFEYYQNFYKHVLDEEDYEKNRLQVYRFLIDAAGDGAVPPMIMPGSWKLGKERTSVNPEVVAGEGILMEAYRSRKLLQRNLETVALKNGLTLEEVQLLFHLGQPYQVHSRQELADFVNMSRNSLARNLQKLSAKGFIQVEDVRHRKKSDSLDGKREEEWRTAERRLSQKQIRVHLLPEADPVLADLDQIEGDYDKVRFTGLSQEEIKQYQRLNGKMKENIQRVLQ